MINEFAEFEQQAKEIATNKAKDYGDSWRLYRPKSIIQKAEIKATRIFNIQEKGSQSISDSIESEFYAIYNYSVLALVSLNCFDYDTIASQIRELRYLKNQDYKDTWKSLLVETMTDEIRVKIQRLLNMNIEHSDFESNIMDIANYSLFCLFKLKYNKENALSGN